MAKAWSDLSDDDNGDTIYSDHAMSTFRPKRKIKKPKTYSLNYGSKIVEVGSKQCLTSSNTLEYIPIELPQPPSCSYDKVDKSMYFNFKILIFFFYSLINYLKNIIVVHSENTIHKSMLMEQSFSLEFAQSSTSFLNTDETSIDIHIN